MGNVVEASIENKVDDLDLPDQDNEEKKGRR